MLNVYGCQIGGPHILGGGKRCLCGATESPVIMERKAFEKMEADLAAAQSRIAGLLLVVEEYRAALRWEWEQSHDETCGSLESICDANPAGCQWSKPDILVADPEARAALLLAVQEAP